MTKIEKAFHNFLWETIITCHNISAKIVKTLPLLVENCGNPHLVGNFGNPSTILWSKMWKSSRDNSVKIVKTVLECSYWWKLWKPFRNVLINSKHDIQGERRKKKKPPQNLGGFHTFTRNFSVWSRFFEISKGFKNFKQKIFTWSGIMCIP